MLPVFTVMRKKVVEMGMGERENRIVEIRGFVREMIFQRELSNLKIVRGSPEEIMGGHLWRTQVLKIKRCTKIGKNKILAEMNKTGPWILTITQQQKPTQIRIQVKKGKQ